MRTFEVEMLGIPHGGGENIRQVYTVVPHHYRRDGVIYDGAAIVAATKTASEMAERNYKNYRWLVSQVKEVTDGSR